MNQVIFKLVPAGEDYMRGQLAIVIKLLCFYTVYIVDRKYTMIDQKIYIFLPRPEKRKSTNEQKLRLKAKRTGAVRKDYLIKGRGAKFHKSNITF